MNSIFKYKKNHYRYNDADRLYNQTRTFAESAKQRAIDAYDEALKLYTDATSIQLPGTDVPALKSNAMLIKREVIIFRFASFVGVNFGIADRFCCMTQLVPARIFRNVLPS